MKKNINATKGRKAEERAAKNLRAERVAGPNNPDLRKGKDRIEVKNYKKPLTKSQLQKAYQQNKANIIISEKGYTEEALNHAKKNMPTIQLRQGTGKNNKIVKRRKYNR